MPVTVHATTRRLSQEEFSGIVYKVMGHVFKVHQEFGRYFDENIYHREIARRCNALNAFVEVPIEVRHGDFRKMYFADLLVGHGAIFELKAVAVALNDRHRSQLLQYLMLTDLPRGKLVNLQSESVQHEFVNTKLRLEDRTSFSIDVDNWNKSSQQSDDFRDAIVSMLRDLGTSLDVGLYEEILTHLLSGADAVLQRVEVRSGEHAVDAHPVRVASPGYSFNITAVRADSMPRVEGHLKKFLAHTPLHGTHWINIRHRLVTFRTLHR